MPKMGSGMHEAKEEIRRLVRLTDVIENYTPVRGKKAICPFHPDTNPSLSISESKGLWHCFVCNSGGDIFTFVMKAESTSFRCAVAILGKRYGITTTYNSHEEAVEARRQINLQRTQIAALKQKLAEDLANLQKHDNFLSGLWKRIRGSDFVWKDVTLAIIEDCFMAIDDERSEIEGRYHDECRKIYKQKTVQIG